jgi:hypothetical protein
LATTTVPPRTAWLRPATPSTESLRNSKGSQNGAVVRRRMTSIGCSPSSVFSQTRPSRMVRSSPSTSVYPNWRAR